MKKVYLGIRGEMLAEPSDTDAVIALHRRDKSSVG